MSERAPLTELELGISAKLAGASFPPATASKRLVRDLESGHIKSLSDAGRKFMAYVTHRFRRQYQLTAEEREWVDLWLAFEVVKPEPVEKPEPETPASSPQLTIEEVYGSIEIK